MQFLQRVKAVFSPSKATNPRAVVGDRPLWEQYTRIGGGLTPEQVSNILREADMGRPASLVDLFQESRQRDCELQSICGIRDQAVSLTEIKFVVGDDASRKEKEAVDLLRHMVEEFENWPTLIDTLTSSYIFGHSTAETPWKKTGSLILPYRSDQVNLRDFVFRASDGRLRYSPDRFSYSEGVDLLGENPGRILQIQRRIVGDIQMREGLARLLVWSALFRNWSMADWIDVGQMGWRPWRIGTYQKGASQEDIDGLVAVMQQIGRSGAGAIPDTTDIKIEWPKGQAVGGQGKSQHGELFDIVAKEMRKAVLGNTTSTDVGANGDRASTESRDKIRQDIHLRDAAEVASCLRYQLFRYVIEANLGPGVRTPIGWFDLDGEGDQLSFAQACESMKKAGVPIPLQWARSEFGSPEPRPDEKTTFNETTPPGPTD